MSLATILGFTALAFLTGRVLPSRWRLPAMLLASLAALYGLQPSTPIRYLDFWLPTISVFLGVLVWSVARDKRDESWSTFIPALSLAGGIMLLGLTRYSKALCCLTASKPPQTLSIAVFLLICLGFVALARLFLQGRPGRLWLPLAAILGLFLVVKTPPLAEQTSAGLRSLTGQSTALASTGDIAWLGFSYLAFRLLHVLRDYQTGKLPPLAFSEVLTYAFFFPAVAAGPIDRAQRFLPELKALGESDVGPVSHQLLWEGIRRLLLGSFKKFVLGDSLALLALDPHNAGQIGSANWAWVLLYAFSLRLYFDFSGYTDIALGLGNLMGIQLPDNFDRPYLKPNLTAFWNSWHITLAQWFRAYVFNPLTRALRSSSRLPAWSVILAGQFTTMLLIGLWHGVTFNFALWGAWHAAGLFVHNRWLAWARPRLTWLDQRAALKTLAGLCGWFVTFHYVTLGWVWFVMPTPASSWAVFLRLLGR